MITLDDIKTKNEECESDDELNTFIFNSIKSGDLSLDIFLEYTGITQGNISGCL